MSNVFLHLTKVSSFKNVMKVDKKSEIEIFAN